jgi:hypothetical protein
VNEGHARHQARSGAPEVIDRSAIDARVIALLCHAGLRSQGLASEGAEYDLHVKPHPLYAHKG